MECPACHSASQQGQKFCDDCGRNLQWECASCGATNLPNHGVCNRCGKSPAGEGTIALERSGLVADIDKKEAELLGYTKEEMAGKPFSLFVAREDLPVFFSHWNELISSGERQTCELALKHKNGQKKHIMIEWMPGGPGLTPGRVYLRLNPEGAHRSAMERLQHQQELLNLIYSLADSVRTASDRHQATAIVQGLKKICLFLKADHCFIYTIDRRRRRLQISHQWFQPAGPDEKRSAGIVPLAAVKRSIARLRRERVYLIDDVFKLPMEERNGLLAAFHELPAALTCQLIYTHKRPIAIIGIARNRNTGEWDADAAALIKLFGQLVCDLPALGPVENPPPSPETLPGRSRERHVRSTAMENAGAVQNPAPQPSHPQEKDQKRIETPARNPARGAVEPLPKPGEPMRLEKKAGLQSIARQRVFVREDGLILLTCPHCGSQESVTSARFEMLGNAVTVHCACGKQFAAVLEKRRSVRKAVQLEGFFTVTSEHGPDDARGSIWGPMVVKNLSKSGLRFSTPRVNLIHPGDLLMARFNLNNSTKALIHKKALVVSIQKNEVGCRFEGADEYDITLGFYFM
jgi:PAS domain-containing protein